MAGRPGAAFGTFVHSSTNATTLVWDFGDGSAPPVVTTAGDTLTTGATGQPLLGPTHVYAQARVYTVTLTASDGITSQTQTRPGYITVTGLFTRNWQVITAATIPPVAGEHGLAYDSTREVVILYGGNATGWPYENTTWEFDGTDRISVTTTTTPAARYGAGLAYLSTSDSTILFGGSDETDTALAQTWEYTNTEWSQVFPITSPVFDKLK